MKKRTTIDITHTGMGGVVRVDINDEHPARTAARILAQREFGRAGEVGALRLDSWAPDGSTHTYEAFIGRTWGGGIDGHNVWIYV